MDLGECFLGDKKSNMDCCLVMWLFQSLNFSVWCSICRHCQSEKSQGPRITWKAQDSGTTIVLRKRKASAPGSRVQWMTHRPQCSDGLALMLALPRSCWGHLGLHFPICKVGEISGSFLTGVLWYPLTHSTHTVHLSRSERAAVSGAQ